MRQVRLVETTVLVLVGILLAAAVVNDVVRQAHVNRRLVADLRTWRTVTGHDYKNLTVEQTVFGETSTTDVVCGNTTPGAPKTKIQICLAIGGPTVDGRREINGGWYLPADSEEDLARVRYGCFGPDGEGRCPKAKSAGRVSSATAGRKGAA